MSKPLKNLISDELHRTYRGTDSALVVNPIALSGTQSNDFRRALKAKRIVMHLVKNSLARRGLVGTPLAGAATLLDGASALVTGGESIVDVAREVQDWTRKLTALEVRGAIVEGQILDAEGVKALSKMPSRGELQGQIVMLARAPGARVASAVTAPGARLAGCIKALVEKLEKSAPAAEAAA